MMIPLNTTLSTWAASLIVDFPTDNIPILKDEKEWQKWGKLLIQETTFAENGAPGTSNFSEWKPWAQAVFNTMSNY